MSDDVSVGCLSMSSCRCHVPVESLEIVTLGAVQAVAEDVADGVGLGVLDGVSELEVLASAEALRRRRSAVPCGRVRRHSVPGRL